jgi:hypothetical protein
MGLLSTEVEVGLSGKNIKYYENKGYNIPRTKKPNGRITVSIGTKILVSVKDLMLGSDVKVEVRCDYCNKVYLESYSDYNNHNHKGKCYCKNCVNTVLLSGEKSYRWNKNKTEEERVNGRSTKEYNDFVRTVQIRDNWTCQCCKKKNNIKLEVHHLNGYNWCVEGRLDFANAITLCSNCHKNFHSIYGQGNNTKQQFEEWIGHTIEILNNNNIILEERRKVFCFEDNFIFKNADECAKYANCTANSIYMVCNGQCDTIYGKHYIWYDLYLSMTDEEKIAYSVKNQNRIHRQNQDIIDVVHEQIYSREECLKYFHIDKPKLYAVCNGKSRLFNPLDKYEQIILMYYDDYIKLGKEKSLQIANNRINSSMTKSVINISTGIVYNSVTNASRDNKISKNRIVNMCRSSNTGTPLRFMYYHDFLNLSLEEQNKIILDNHESFTEGSFLTEKYKALIA